MKILPDNGPGLLRVSQTDFAMSREVKELAYACYWRIAVFAGMDREIRLVRRQLRVVDIVEVVLIGIRDAVVIPNRRMIDVI